MYCDLQEGPHSTLNDEEFYDAVETGLDKMDEELELHDRLKTKQQQQQQMLFGPCKALSKASQHHLWPEVSNIVAIHSISIFFFLMPNQHVNKLCVQNAEFLNDKLRGTYSNT